MDEFLREYYGTGQAEDVVDDDALEKMAQLTIIANEAAAQGHDISHLTEEQALQLYDEVYGEAEAEGGGEMEKEAAEQFETADFLGRVMAHSMWQELETIQKEAGAASELGQRLKGTLVGARWEAAKAGQKASKAGKKALEWIGEKGTIGSKAKARAMQEMAEGGQPAYEAMMRRRGKRIAIGGGVAAGAAGAGAGGAALASRKKEKKGSAFDTLVEQRAIEHLATAGYVDGEGNIYGPEGPPTQEKVAGGDFDTAVDAAALEMLAGMGYPVE